MLFAVPFGSARHNVVTEPQFFAPTGAMTVNAQPSSATLPSSVANVFRLIRKALRKFESERRVEPPRYAARFEITALVTEDDLDGGWVAECLDLPGCVSQGDTEEEALENLTDAIGGVISARVNMQLREKLPELHEREGSARHEHKIDICV